MLVLWLTGLVAEDKNWHRNFQANTVRSHRVLSLIFLGAQVLQHARDKLKLSDFKKVLRRLHENEANL